jgi:hypothetical protein
MTLLIVFLIIVFLLKESQGREEVTNLLDQVTGNDTDCHYPSEIFSLLLEITRHGSAGTVLILLDLEVAPVSWKKRLRRGSCMEEERQWNILPLQHHGDQTLSIWFSSTSQAVNIGSRVPFIGAGGRGPLPLI